MEEDFVDDDSDDVGEDEESSYSQEDIETILSEALNSMLEENNHKEEDGFEDTLDAKALVEEIKQIKEQLSEVKEVAGNRHVSEGDVGEEDSSKALIDYINTPISDIKDEISRNVLNQVAAITENQKALKQSVQSILNSRGFGRIEDSVYDDVTKDIKKMYISEQDMPKVSEVVAYMVAGKSLLASKSEQVNKGETVASAYISGKSERVDIPKAFHAAFGDDAVKKAVQALKKGVIDEDS